MSFIRLDFSVGSSFFARFCIILEHKAVRCSIFRAKIATHMPWSTSNCFVQNAAQFVLHPPLGKSLNIIEQIEGLSYVDTSPRS